MVLWEEPFVEKGVLREEPFKNQLKKQNKKDRKTILIFIDLILV